MKKMVNKKSHSWLWDGHINPKNSKWMADNLEEADSHVKEMLKLIEEEGDSFAKKAEMYYQRRPELVSHVEDLYRMYRALAERYDHLTGELRKNIPRSPGISETGSAPPSPPLEETPEQKSTHVHVSPTRPGFKLFLDSPGNSASRSPSSSSESGSGSENEDALETGSLLREVAELEEKAREREREIEEMKAQLEAANETIRQLQEEKRILEMEKKSASEEFFRAQEEMFRERNKEIEEMGARFSEERSRMELGMKAQLEAANEAIRQLQEGKRSLEMEKNSAAEEFFRAQEERLRERNKEIEEMGARFSEEKSRMELGLKAQLDAASEATRRLEMEKLSALKEMVREREREAEEVSEMREKLGESEEERRRLEAEVEGQRAVILEEAEKKREAIRQLCFSLQHYRDGYNELRQALLLHQRPLALLSS